MTTETDKPKPKYEFSRETRFEYTENMGDAYKSVSVETFLTYNETVRLCHELMGAHDGRD